MKVMEVVPDDYMILFFCIDYTVWPGEYGMDKMKALNDLKTMVSDAIFNKKAGTTAESSSSRAARH